MGLAGVLRCGPCGHGQHADCSENRGDIYPFVTFDILNLTGKFSHQKCAIFLKVNQIGLNVAKIMSQTAMEKPDKTIACGLF